MLAGVPAIQLRGGISVRGCSGRVGGGGVGPPVSPAVLHEPHPAQRVRAVRRPASAAGVSCSSCEPKCSLLLLLLPSAFAIAMTPRQMDEAAAAKYSLTGNGDRRRFGPLINLEDLEDSSGLFCRQLQPRAVTV